jgi:hypothetical protein
VKTFINLPDSHEIDIADIACQKVIVQWKMNIALANFPMALDEKNHRLFIVCRSPAKLVVMDTGNGKIISMDNCVADADDIYYDEINGCIYISRGEGCVNIFQEQEANVLKKIANIATRNRVRTSLFVPQLQLLLLAERARGCKGAQLLSYKVVQ